MVGFQAPPYTTHVSTITLTIPSNYIVTGTNLRMRVIGYETSSGYCTAEVGNIKDFTAYIKPTSIPIKAFLQGPYVGTLMSDNLRAASPVLIPTTEPYTALGFTHIKGGGETCNASVFTVTGNDAIVDWVFVELRDKNDPTTVLYTRSALIQKDGDIVDVNGTYPVGFKYAAADDYYVAVKHINHLGIRSAAVVALTTATSVYNFSSSLAMAYKPAAHPNEAMADLGGGVFGLFASNANGDGFVKMTGSSPASNDYLKLLNVLGSSTSSIPNTYSVQDLNMDGHIKMVGSSPASNDYLRLLNSLGSSTNSIQKTIN